MAVTALMMAALLALGTGSVEAGMDREQGARAQVEKGRITGIGGVFVASKDPKALAAWYRDVLGLAVESWGGAMLRADAPDHPPVATWAAMPAGGYFAPSTRELMVNFAVDDLDAFVARLAAKHVAILKREDDATGRFAWIMDPDGTKIELWEPKRG